MLNPRGLLGDVLGHALPFFYGIIPVSTNKISILYFLYVLFGIIGTTILNLCWNLMSMNKERTPSAVILNVVRISSGVIQSVISAYLFFLLYNRSMDPFS